MQDAQSEPSDEELMQSIGRKLHDRPSAELAFTMLHRRHVQFLYRCACLAEKKLVGHGMGADDIVALVFAKVWKRAASSFTMPPGLDRERQFRRTQLWLAAIARNLVKDKLKAGKFAIPVDPGGENESLFLNKEESEGTRPNLELTRAIAQNLSDRDAAIVWFKIRHYDRDSGQSEPPPDELAAFCKEWEVTPVALRKAYARALKTISQALATVAR